ncbi:hypothetical protein BVC80_889g6 [Macleaya cordata]|uniref:Uncharacterized protein n=1 Tax=Macleaya cordata TaxID=56857 RepID=A0A200R8S3_MACCD|nr:hypothetical protein BVC80_889g6 [Macleaya cordata]
MASSSSYSPHQSAMNLSCSILFLLLLLPISCTSTRLGAMVTTVDTKPSTSSDSDSSMVLINQEKLVVDSHFQGRVFNFFPRGTPIPPSGPSKRHNSIPHN